MHISNLGIEEKLDLILKSIRDTPKSTPGRRTRRSGFKNPTQRAEKVEGRKEKLVGAFSSLENACSLVVGMGTNSYE